MNIREEIINSLKLAASPNISDEVFKKLSENSFSSLIDNREIYSLATLYNSKPDLIKCLYGAFLTLGAEFGRHNLNKDDVAAFLINKCSYTTSRANVYAELYDRNKTDLKVILGNIGSHLPNVNDVQWKIDYIIKTSNMDQSDGPLFRICLVTDKYDQETGGKKTEHVKFTCNSQQLQDLVYKLKDAVRHCQRFTVDH